MFGVVKDEDVSRGSLCSDDEWILWHVAGTVHLSVVIYLDVDFNFSTHGSKPTVFYSAKDRKREREKERIKIQWNPSLRTPLKRGHLSNTDTLSPVPQFLQAI